VAIGIPAGTARKKQPRPTCPLRLPGCGTVVSTVNLNLFSVCHGIGHKCRMGSDFRVVIVMRYYYTKEKVW